LNNIKPITTTTFYQEPYFWLTLLLSLPVIGPLLQPYYFWGGHDARHSVYFLYEFNQAILDGQWYPRWSPNFAFGYGYPFFNIYGPLPSYLGQILLWLGLDIVTAVKTIFGLAAILAGVSMYMFGRDLLNPPAAFIAALSYVYLPYHLFDLYVRVALAESVGFVFVPLTMWGFYRAVTAPKLRHLLLAALAYALLMFTSNLLALIFTPILGLYVATMLIWQFISDPMNPHPNLMPPHPQPLSQGERGVVVVSLLPLGEGLGVRGDSLSLWERAGVRALRLISNGLPPLSVLLLGLGLSGIFWLPAFLEYRYVRVDQWIGGRFAFGNDFVELFQLFSPRWGFGTSIPGPDDQAGFQLGLAVTVLFLLSFMAVPKLPSPLARRTLYFCQSVTLVVVFLITPMSYPVWLALPLSSFAQFPWRLLVVVAPFIAIVSGSIMTTMPPTKNQVSLPVITLASLIILASYPYIKAEAREPKATEGPVSQAAMFRFQQSSDEMTGQTAWTREIPNWSTLAEQVARGGQITTKVNYTALPSDNSVGVYSMEMDSVHERLWVGTAKPNQSVTFFIPYYPGWQAYIYEDLGPHDGNLDKTVGPITRVGSIIAHPVIQTTPREGWLIVPIPQGSHFLEIRFTDTIIRSVGRWISALSAFIWIGLFLFSYFSKPLATIWPGNSYLLMDNRVSWRGYFN